MHPVRQAVTPAILELARMFMERDGYAVAGPLHLWMADPNYDRRCAALSAGACFDTARWPDDDADDYRRLAYYIARIAANDLTATQRSRLAYAAWERRD